MEARPVTRLALVLTLLARPAWAGETPSPSTTNSPICWPSDCAVVLGNATTSFDQRLTGDADLDRAKAICDAHVDPLFIFTEPPPSPTWGAPWDKLCPSVIDRWQKSESDRAEREAAEKDRADIEWLKAWAGRQK
jgi:hypothetical protein